MLSCNYVAYFQNTFLKEYLWRADSDLLNIAFFYTFNTSFLFLHFYFRINILSYDKNLHHNPANLYLIKDNNRKTGTSCKTCSSLPIGNTERRQWLRSGFFNINWTDFLYYSGVSIVDSEQVNVAWEWIVSVNSTCYYCLYIRKNTLTRYFLKIKNSRGFCFLLCTILFLEINVTT